MRKKTQNKTYQPTISYENESVTVTMECCKYLLENNFYENSIKDNLRLIEEFLTKFSLLRLIKWECDLGNVDAVELEDLELISHIVNFSIPTQAQKEAYFNQYVHCIIYLLGVMNKQTQIEWKKENLTEKVEIRYNKNLIEEIVTNKQLPSYQIPSKILIKLNGIYAKEEVPVLTK